MVTAPIRVQLSRAKGWRKPPNTVVVARPSRWGNPFKVEREPGWPRWAGSAPWRIVTPDGKLWHVSPDHKVIVGRAAADRHRRREALQRAVDLFATHVGPMER